MSRRRLIGAALSLAAGASPAWSAPAASSGPRLGRASRFSFKELKASAQAAALRPYAPNPPAPALASIDYDAIGKIQYRPSMTLWRGRPGDLAIRFFHLGRYARTPVSIYAVESGEAREVLYAESLFDVDDPALARRLAAEAGFAGFRVMNPDHQSDWLAFQGASYFRSADPFNQYGLSARGLAINTATDGPESFPNFTRFWLERDRAGRLAVYAMLEGDQVTGAFRIVNQRGPKGLVQDITCALFFRKPVARLGVAALTSMFW